MIVDLAAHAALLEPHLTIVRPEGPGPFPVVVQMHGCGGPTSMQSFYAKAAREAGVAAVIVDSLAPRGIGRREAQLTIYTGARLRGAERASDLVAALSWLETQPWADPTRAAAVGWSHGGWAVMEAMVAGSRDQATGPTPIDAVKLAVLFYPYAGPFARTYAHGWGSRRPRVLAFIAGRDAVVGRVAPRRAIGRLQADGLEVEVLEFPDATHAFDDEQGVDPRFRFRPDLADQARRAYAAALARALTAEGVV